MKLMENTMTNIKVADYMCLTQVMIPIVNSVEAIAVGDKFSAHSKGIRYYSWGVQYFNTCIELGMTPSTNDHHFLPMSEEYYNAWVDDKEVKPTKEHMTPLNLIINDLVAMNLDPMSMDDLQTAYEYLTDNLQVVLVTDAEDEALKNAGLSSEVPADGSCRYESVGINILPTPILHTVANWKKLRNNG